MKKTSLFDIHLKFNGKMVPFAGYSMPVQFDGVNSEHLQVRNSVGIFDVSHMGEILVKGNRATDFLNYICSNDILLMKDGKAQYNCLINTNGGIIDDLIVYKLGDENYMLVVNAANIDKDWNWIKKQNSNFNTEINNISEKTSLLALQGPKSEKVLQKLVNFDLNKLTNYSFTIETINNINNIIISKTGYTGSGGYELYVENDHVLHLYKLILDSLQQNVAQIRIARVFNHHLFLLVNQQLGDQIQRVLRPQSDQNLFRPGFDAAAWQAARTDIIDQHRIIMLAKITGHRREIAHAQRLSCAIAPFRMRK